MADLPEVTILLLGDAECGKSTFLSYVTSFPLYTPVHDPRCQQHFQVSSHHSIIEMALRD
jgi:hypothetical protein